MIKVTDKYYISVDDNYTVYEKTVVKNGKNAGTESYVNPSYYGTMSMALNNVVHRIQKDELKSEEIITLQEAVKTMVDVQNEFNEILKGIEDYYGKED